MRAVTAFLAMMLLAVSARACFAQDVPPRPLAANRLPVVAENLPGTAVLPTAYFQGPQPTLAEGAAPQDAPAQQPYPSTAACCPQCCCAPCECPEKGAPCLPCPRINLANPGWNLLLGGWLELDMLFNSARPVAPGVPFFLAPGSPFGFDQDTFDAHARQTALYGLFSGPEIGDFKAGGFFFANLFNDAVIVDRYGFLPIQAFGELKNDLWRFAAGLQIDIFAPRFPTVLPFSYLVASGNAGVYRGQLRAERFIHVSDEEQVTLTAGISDPIATTVNNVEISEDNGWPNIELRAAWALGPVEPAGFLPQRPFEVGLSSVVGQLRTTDGATRVVANVWGLAGDFRCQFSDRVGLAGEIYTGQGLGTYGAAIFQSVNDVTFQAVHATGGWLELFYYLTPCLHSHTGFGIDDPVDSELAATQIAFNRTIFTNLIWDVTRSFRLAGEITFRRTNYITFDDNDGVGFQGQTQWRF